MKFRLKSRFSSVLAIAFLSAVTLDTKPAQAGLFGQKEVKQSDFTLMATPYNSGYSHQLTVIGQISDEQACWKETLQAGGPTLIDPLLLNFDFSGICSRGVDGNGYSVRIHGEDMFVQYRPKIIQREGELQLMAQAAVPDLPDLLIARSRGKAQAFSKLVFEPGWRLTQRIYGEKALGHFYLTNDQSLANLIGGEAAFAQR